MSRDSTVRTAHVPASALESYAAGANGVGMQDAWWTVEAHLETCAACREVLAEAVRRRSPQTALILDRVRVGLVDEIVRGLRMPTRRRALPRRLSAVAKWSAPVVLPRLVMTVVVIAVAVGLDLADAAASGRFPSLVLLLAPVAPLAGVAATWSRRLDPAHELVVASPRAGLDLVLRRTAIVLAVVVPVLAIAGWLVEVSPARWLLPCLAFTVGSLALGELVGLHRAARGLAVGWVAVVVGPSLVREETPAVLDPGSLLGWVVATVVVAVVMVVRRRGYAGLASLR